MEHNKIFISYAKEDIIYAEQFYDFLLNRGYSPWLDKKNLLPGQDWNFMIQEALYKADFIVLLLSNISVNKRGYVQREFRKAVDYCETKLDSDIYIIPVMINECDVPFSLQKFQWIKFDDGEVFEQIQSALELQRSKLQLEKSIALQDNNPVIIDYICESELGTRSPKHIYEFNYFQFQNTTEESHLELNTVIKSEVINSLFNVRNNFYKYLDIRPQNIVEIDDWINTTDSSSFGKFEIRLNTQDFISFTFFLSEYYTGTMHGMFGTSGNNYIKNPLRKFELIDLFDDINNFLVVIRELVHEKLMILAEKSDAMPENEATMSEDEINEFKRNSFYVYDEGLEAKEENFNNYYFTKDSIVFIYNPYDITAWSEGDHFPEIEFNELKRNFSTEKRFLNFIKSIQTPM